MTWLFMYAWMMLPSMLHGFSTQELSWRRIKSNKRSTAFRPRGRNPTPLRQEMKGDEHDGHPYDLILDTRVIEKATTASTKTDTESRYIDGSLLSSLLMEMYGAQSVVTTDAAVAARRALTTNNDDSSAPASTPTLLLEEEPLFDEPAISASTTLSKEERQRRHRRAWRHARIVARMPSFREAGWTADQVLHALQEDIPSLLLDENDNDNHNDNSNALTGDQSSKYEFQSHHIAYIDNPEQEANIDWCAIVQKSWPPAILGPQVLIVLPFHTKKDCQKVIASAAAKTNEASKQQELDLPQKDEEDGNETSATTTTPRNDTMFNDIPTTIQGYDTIRIEGGSAFGSGDHPTTRLCSRWLLHTISNLLPLTTTPHHKNHKEEKENETRCLRVMDYGSGSGILSLVALLAGRRRLEQLQKQQEQQESQSFPTVHVTGVEVDPRALEVSRRNCLHNHYTLPHNVEFYGPMENSPGSEVWDELVLGRFSSLAGGSKEKEEEEGMQPLPSEGNLNQYQVLVANILAAPLVALAPTLASLVVARPSPGGDNHDSTSSSGGGGGRLALSGLTLDQAEVVQQAYEPYFDGMEIVEQEGEWVLLQGWRNDVPVC